jgi:hypothetical protein
MIILLVSCLEDGVNAAVDWFKLVLQFALLLTNLVPIVVNLGHFLSEGRQAPLADLIWDNFVKAPDHFFYLLLLSGVLL